MGGLSLASTAAPELVIGRFYLKDSSRVYFLRSSLTVEKPEEELMHVVMNCIKKKKV